KMVEEKLREDFKEIIENHVCWRDINGGVHNAGTIDESDIKVMVDELFYKADKYCEQFVAT
ncbi:unnamed protein product, partial [marine sediment metagenome]